MHRLVLASLLLLPCHAALAENGLAEAFRVTGLSRPESFVADPTGEGYFLSNVDGSPGEKDGNGFLTRLDEEGKVAALRWAPPGEHGMPALDAPKGLAVWLPATEDRRAPVTRYLVIADLTRIVILDVTGTSPPAIVDLAPAGAKFLNDVAVADDGTVYVSDTAAACLFKVVPNYTPRKREPEPVKLLDLGTDHPNGICLHAPSLRAVTWGEGRLLEISLGEKPAATALPLEPALENLDGLFELRDEVWFSSYSEGAVYRWRDGRAEPVLTGLTTPADVGVDPRRRLLLVPLMEADEAAAYRIPE